MSGRWFTLVPATVALALLAACAHVPTTHYYVLQKPRPDTAPPGREGAATGPVIGVERFTVDPPYDQDRIIYRVGENSTEIGYYDYHRWATPLSRMLPGMVGAVLEDQSLAMTLEPALPGHDYHAVLGGRVRVLEEVDTPAGPHVDVRIDLHLRTGDGTTIWSGDIGGRRSLQTKNVGDLVSLMRSMLEESLRQTASGMAIALREYDDLPESGMTSAR